MTARAWGLLGFALVLLLSAVSARAETIAATLQQIPLHTIGTATIENFTGANHSKDGIKFNSWGEACAAVVGVNSCEASDCFSTGGRCKKSGVYKTISKWEGTGCNQSETNINNQCGTYVCPSGQNWTLNGTACTRPDCASGEVRDPATGVCGSACGSSGATWNGSACKCPGVQDFNATDKTCNCYPATLQYRGSSIGGTGDVPDTTCFDGCTGTVSGLVVSAGGQWAGQLGKFTGAKCTEGTVAKTPTEDTRTPEQKCLAAGGGFITTSSGTVCTSSGDSPVPIKKITKENETNKDGTGTTTDTTETVTECIGTVCTTTIITRDGNGNITGTKTIDGPGGGGGGGGDGESECDLHPNTIGCSEYGTPSDGDALQSQNVGLNSLSPAISSAGSCPADINLPKGMKFSWEYVCMYANGIRPVIIALAWLSAGFLLFGMRLD